MLSREGSFYIFWRVLRKALGVLLIVGVILVAKFLGINIAVGVPYGALKMLIFSAIGIGIFLIIERLLFGPEDEPLPKRIKIIAAVGTILAFGLAIGLGMIGMG